MDADVGGCVMAYTWTSGETITAPKLNSTGTGDYASVSALKAVTGMSDNDLAIVESYGLYRYDLASTDISDDTWVIAPDSGTGRWLCEAPGVYLITELVGI